MNIIIPLHIDKCKISIDICLLGKDFHAVNIHFPSRTQHNVAYHTHYITTASTAITVLAVCIFIVFRYEIDFVSLFAFVFLF